MDELREFIASDGQRGPHFRIYAIHPRNLNTRLDTAEETARSLGIIFNFEKDELMIDADGGFSRSVRVRLARSATRCLGRHPEQGHPSWLHPNARDPRSRAGAVGRTPGPP